MEYSSEVRRRFLAPARAGDIPRDAGNVVEGAAEDRSLNVWFRFQVQLHGRLLARVRFRAYGCPHALAAADSIAEELEGRPVDALTGLDLAALAERISLPREKFGKLLRIEDALTECKAQFERKDLR
jgi:NifU-like protein involved in Fe-S cluster formation